MSLRATALVLCALAAAVTPAYATDYYVSSHGSDAAAGTTASSAWRTIARVNDAHLADGDRVLFEGGSTFTGSLVLDPSDGGTSTSPITLTSYGAGRAVLAASANDALLIYNRAAVDIRSLDFRGSSTAGAGIALYADDPTDSHAFVRIQDVDVSGFTQDGIQLGVWNGAPGFDDVRITRATVHDNDRTGILTYADRPNVHRNVYVGYSRAYGNSGIASATTNTGSGIVLGSVNGGTVERSVAHDNGSRSVASEGPVGIWTYDSTRIVIQHNESYRNHTAGPSDGGGFDLDQNVSDSTVQFNYSHDNDGAGFLLAHAYATDVHRGNVVRFNISQDDGRKNGYGGIEIWGRTVNAAIYQNTVVTSGATVTPAAIRVHNTGVAGVRSQGVRVINNIFYTRGIARLASVTTDQLAAKPVLFAGNSYYATTTFSLVWGASTLTSLGAFRAVGQEQVGGVMTGLSGNPGLSSPGAGGTLDDASRLESLDAYRLLATSIARDHGVSLATFGLSAGATDYFGVPLAGTVPDIGASEYHATPSDPSEGSTDDIVIWTATNPVLHGNWAIVSDPTAAGQARVHNANKGAPKVATPSSAPADYFEQTFTAQAGMPYRLWIRGTAEKNAYDNDSAYVQFSGSVDAAGSPLFRIGTTSATTYVLENCSGCGVSGWGWQDNGYGLSVLGPEIYFATTGTQTIRVQAREDGIGIDQIVLSPSTYATKSPGAAKNDATILTLGGDAAPAPPSPVPSASEIVLWAADNPRIVGRWSVTADGTAAGSARVSNPNRDTPKPSTALANPADFFELTFTATAGIPYRLWLRGIAQNNSYNNDSVFVQFSGSVDAAGKPAFRTGTTGATIVVLEDCSGCGVSGWGWQDNGYGVNVLGPEIYFAVSGSQTIRIQPREDGMSIDQIVLSTSKYFTTSPGRLKTDTTLLTPDK